MANKLNFYLDVEEGANREAVATLISERLLQLEQVQEATAVPTETRLTGAEITAGILLTVTIVKGTRELVKALNLLIPEIKQLITGIKEVKAAAVEVGFEKVMVEETNDAVIEELAEALED